ncbi:MAG TPA: hypothetical protein VH439_00535 [Gemmatimonadales bacterium]|jgi:hypothetical protein
MTTTTTFPTTRTDVSAAIGLLLIAEAALFFTFLFVIGPIATPIRLMLFVVILVLCAALYRGQNWARWALLVPIAVRAYRLALLTAAAWGLHRGGTAVFLTLIILAELAAAFLLLDQYLVSPKATSAPKTDPLSART